MDEPVGVILTSADGVILTRIAASQRLNRTLDAVNLAPGFSYSEEFAGTNGIGTALATRQPTLVTGAEHYVECLGQLACAGVPITHPISGALVGALDLTGWVEDGGPLLATLAKSATAQIEGRLLAQASAEQTALLNAYLKAGRRAPQLGVLALGDDLVLLNRRLRLALDAPDHAALLEHAVDLTGMPATHRHIVALPSGRSARLSSVEDFGSGSRRQMALFYVHLLDAPSFAVPAIEKSDILSGITGSSAPGGAAASRSPAALANNSGSRSPENREAVALQHSKQLLPLIFRFAPESSRRRSCRGTPTPCRPSGKNSNRTASASSSATSICSTRSIRGCRRPHPGTRTRRLDRRDDRRCTRHHGSRHADPALFQSYRPRARVAPPHRGSPRSGAAPTPPTEPRSGALPLPCGDASTVQVQLARKCQRATAGPPRGGAATTLRHR